MNCIHILIMKGNDIKSLSQLNNFLINKKICNIKHLDLSFNPIDDHILTLINILNVNKTLTYLNLSNIHMNTASLIQLIITLKDNKHLNNINIDNPLLYSLQEETTVHLSKLLQYDNNNIEYISLAKHNIKDFGCRWLANSLKFNKSLKEINLSCNKITNDGVLLLIHALAIRNRSCIINLSNCYLRNQPIDQIILHIEKYNQSKETNFTFTYDTDFTTHILSYK